MKKVILKTVGFVAVAVLMLFNVQLVSGSGDSIISLDYLKKMAYANSENGGGDDNCTPVEIIYQELSGYYTQCCQSVYHKYIDRYYCEIGPNCYCPGRTQTETWTYVGTNCCV